MKKLLIVIALLCLPSIGYGQNLVVFPMAFPQVSFGRDAFFNDYYHTSLYPQSPTAVLLRQSSGGNVEDWAATGHISDALAAIGISQVNNWRFLVLPAVSGTYTVDRYRACGGVDNSRWPSFQEGPAFQQGGCPLPPPDSSAGGMQVGFTYGGTNPFTSQPDIGSGSVAFCYTNNEDWARESTAGGAYFKSAISGYCYFIFNNEEGANQNPFSNVQDPFHIADQWAGSPNHLSGKNSFLIVYHYRAWRFDPSNTISPGHNVLAFAKVGVSFGFGVSF